MNERVVIQQFASILALPIIPYQSNMPEKKSINNVNGIFFMPFRVMQWFPNFFSQYNIMFGETQNIDFYGGPHERISRTTRVPQSLLGQCKVFL
jgi:hypothetical protein